MIGVVALLWHHAAVGQTGRLPDWKSRSGFIGLVAGDFSGDSGVGLEASFRPLFKGPVCIKLRGSINWMEQYKATYGHWAAYSTVSASAVMYRTLQQRARAYMEVGPVLIIPSNKISYKSFVAGASGLIGLELFLGHTESVNLCYFVGGGIVYSRAHADRVEGNPTYGSGIVFSNGIRLYF
jgi:hypothetical protein